MGFFVILVKTIQNKHMIFFFQKIGKLNILSAKKLYRQFFVDLTKLKRLNYTLFVIKDIALLVQLVERRFPKPDVVGSSPTGRV